MPSAVLKEGDLEINFTDAVDSMVFDQTKHKDLPNYHGLNQMHRVDFVVETASQIIFVEVKDPKNPRAQREGLLKFQQELEDGTLGRTMANKFRDTFIYRWAEKKVTKPVCYYNLITLDDELLPVLNDEIRRLMPPLGIPSKAKHRWRRSYCEACTVLSLNSWNEMFEQWPARRISATPASV